MTNNPYQAPTSDVTQADGHETYQPQIFTTKGRIGRLRYLAYSLASYIFIIPGLILMAFASNAEGPSTLMTIGGVVLGAGYLALMVFVFILAKRRFNDLDKTGWMSLLLLIPLVNLFVGLWMMFGAGTQHSNQFGPKPSANSLLVKIFGLIMPIVFIGGILAAVMIPAYSDYAERAKASESLYQE